MIQHLVQRLIQQIVVRCSCHRTVEGVIQSVAQVDILRVQMLMLRVQANSDLIHIGLGSPPCRQLRGSLFQIHAHLQNVVDRLLIQRNDLDPLAPAKEEVTLLLQLQQRFAHRCAADAQFLTDRLLRVDRVRLKLLI